MSAFEESLLNGIPLAEASSFFIRLKTAASRGRAKRANQMGFGQAGGGGQAGSQTPPMLPGTGQGKNPIPTATSTLDLPQAAMGKVAKNNLIDFAAAFKEKVAELTRVADTEGITLEQASELLVKRASDKDLHDLGKARAHASLAAEFEKDKHHQNEAKNGLVGNGIGAVLGALAAKKGGNLASVGGAALGSHLGGKVGRHVGANKDRAAWDKHAAQAIKIALEGAGIPLAPETQGYIANEQSALEAEGAQQAEYLRAKLQEAQQAAAQAGEQNMNLQQQVESSNATLQQMQAQVSDSLMQTQQAQDQVLQQQQAAAAVRMAYQQMRGQLLEVAANDPPGIAGSDAAMMASQAAAPTAPQAPGGPAAEAPGAPPTGGGGPGPAPGGAEAPATPPGPPASAAPAEETGQKQAAYFAAIRARDPLRTQKEAALRALPFARAAAR